MSDPQPGDPQGGPQVAPLVAESCGTCFFGREHTFSMPASGLRSAQRNDVVMLVCCQHSPSLISGQTDLQVVEARWAAVRPDYWCGEWSDTGAPVVR